jgi:hypothetical protein
VDFFIELWQETIMMARLMLKSTISIERAIFVSMGKHCWTLKDSYESQFAAAFYPILLSDTKRAEIIHRAEEIRAVRNDISEVFFSDMLFFSRTWASSMHTSISFPHLIQDYVVIT